MAGVDMADSLKAAGPHAIREAIEGAAVHMEGPPPWHGEVPPPDAPPGPSAHQGGPAPAAMKPLKLVDAFDFNEAEIPRRPWLVRGLLLSGYTHMLAAPGGSGKSLFTLQLAIMLATGMQWGPWKPSRPCRTLVINVEDDIDEQRRRLAAARRIMGVPQDDLRGMVLLAEDPQSIVVAKVDGATKAMVATPRAGELRELIDIEHIGAIFVDPFAETFEGDENSNSEVKWAMKVWRDEIAKPTHCATHLNHHTTKYAGGRAGDADVIRGAGALVNSTRISSTLFQMTADEAKALGIEPEDRNRYVRFDYAKTNQTLTSATAKWFEKISVTIENGAEDQAADEVGALKPWLPPSAFAGCSLTEIHTALEAIERGVPDDDGRASGDLYTKHFRKDSKRWVGIPIKQHMGVSDAKARVVIEEWEKSGLLYETTYSDKKEGKPKKGLAVDRDHMPDHAEGLRYT